MEEPQIPLAPETLPGSWCWHPDYPSGAPEFTLFRLAFRTARQRTVRLLFSADNRCNLFLDGVFVGRGPARGDLEHYRYESCTLELPPGSHVLAAEVIVYPCGFREEEGPWSEIHTGGGFLILSGDAAFATPGSWRCRRDASRRHRKWRDSWNGRGGIPAPPMEEYEPDPALTGWKLPEFDDSDWPAVRHVGEPYFADRCKTDPPTRWRLVPGTTPPMRQEPVAVRSILAGTNFSRRTVPGERRGASRPESTQSCSTSGATAPASSICVSPAEKASAGSAMRKRFSATASARSAARSPAAASGSSDFPTC